MTLRYCLLIQTTKSTLAINNARTMISLVDNPNIEISLSVTRAGLLDLGAANRPVAQQQARPFICPTSRRAEANISYEKVDVMTLANGRGANFK